MMKKRTFTALADDLPLGQMREVHWRVIYICARHYRLGHGPKAAMSQQLIAKLAMFSRETVNKAIRDLRSWGKMDAVIDPSDRRSRRYVPVYGDGDDDTADDAISTPKTNGTDDRRQFVYGSITDAEMQAKARLYAKDTPFARDQMKREDPGVLDYLRRAGRLPALN